MKQLKDRVVSRGLGLILCVGAVGFASASAQRSVALRGEADEIAALSLVGVTRSYEDVRAEMRRWVEQAAGRATLVTLGLNDQNIPIEGVRFGTGAGVRGLVVATHHGNEYGSTAVALGLGQSLAGNAQADATITVIPVLNIGGFESRSRQERAANRRSYDPNRDYPNPCRSDAAYQLKSTRALAEYLDREQVVVSATLHTYHPAVVYPLGFAARDLSTPYDALFLQLSQAAVVESGYTVGNSAEVIYPATGTFEDFAYLQRGTWSLLFEIGATHSPSDAELGQITRVNVPGLRRFIAQSPAAPAEKHAFTSECVRGVEALDLGVE